eukprot:2801511-Alexandrium_andersonii.AAC.1
MPDDSRAQCHPLTTACLAAGSQLRAEIQQFVGGVALNDLPALSFQAARLAFVPLSEQRAEAKHSQFSKELKKAPHSGAPKLSLLDRMPEIHAVLRESNDGLEQLSRDASAVSHPIRAAGALTFSAHPDWEA